MSGAARRWFVRLRESFPRIGKNLQSHPDRSRVTGYDRPVSLRTSFSVVSLAYTAVLIAGLEYCFRTLPVSEHRRNIPNGPDSEVYGPFNAAPLARVINDSQSSFAPSLAVTWNSSAILTPTPTTTEIEPPIISTSLPSSEEDSPDGTVYLASWPGILGFNFDSTPNNNTTQHNNTTTTTNTNLNRRVPPPDKWGQLPGRVQYVQFDVTGTLDFRDPTRGVIWAYIEYFYDSDDTFLPWASIKASPSYCPTVCDGPALVFLESYCWDLWKNKASMYRVRTASYPLATHTQSEYVWKEGTPCPTAIASPPLVVEVPPQTITDIVMTTTRSVEVEIIDVTTVSGQPTTLTRTTQIALPIEVIVVPTPTGPAEVVAEPTNDEDRSWSPTTTIIQKDALGRPTATLTGRIRATETIMTLTNPVGRPTATITTKLPLASSVVTFSGSDGIETTTTILVPVHHVAGQEDSLLTLTDSDGVPVATVTITPQNPQPEYQVPTLPGIHSGPGGSASLGKDGAETVVGPDFHPISWRDYLFATFGPILLTMPLAMLVQRQSGSLKALLPYYILSLSSTSGTSNDGLSASGYSGGTGNGATASDSLCLATGGLVGMRNAARLFFSGISDPSGTSTKRKREPLGLLADLHVLVMSAVVSLSSEALGIKLTGRCQVDDFRGCHMGVSLFEVPGRMVQALLAVSLVLGVLNGLILLRRGDWKRAVDIYARHGNRGVTGLTDLLAGSSEDTKEYFRKVSNNLADISASGDGYISNKELARQLDERLFTIRVHANAAHSVGSLGSTSKDEKDSLEKINLPTTTTYHLEAIPRETKDDSAFTWSTDLKGEEEEKTSQRRTIKSRLGQLCPKVSPDQQDMLSQLGFILAMVGVLVLVLYYELTSNPDSAFERFMNSQGLGVRTLFTALGVIVSLFWDCHSSEICTKEPYRQLIQSSTSSTSFSSSPFTFSSLGNLNIYNHLIIITTTGAALSKVTPLLLSNVPFSPWLTWRTHEVCTWTVIGILGFMILVVSYTVTRVGRASEQMSIHPGTLAGRLFYVARYKLT